MKKCMILFTLLIGCLWIKAQSVVPQVNENVERRTRQTLWSRPCRC